MANIKIFTFGTENDPLAWQVADRLKGTLSRANETHFSFIKTSNPDDIMPDIINDTTGAGRGDNIIIMDAASGIKKPAMLTIRDLEGRPVITTHDLDLGFMLKLLERAGKLRNKDVRIIGIPRNSRPDAATAEKVSRLLKQLYVEETSR